MVLLGIFTGLFQQKSLIFGIILNLLLFTMIRNGKGIMTNIYQNSEEVW